MLEDGSINPGQMTSFNHYALGSVCNFLHGKIGGLSPLEPGWKKALVRPLPGGTVRSAKVSFDSPYGPYSVDWAVESVTGLSVGGKMKVKVGVPPACSAQVVLPGVDEVVGSGQYEFDTTWEEEKDWPPQVFQGPQGITLKETWVA